MECRLPLRYAPVLLAICFLCTGLLLTACGGVTSTKLYTIGVVNYYAVLEPVLAGFKAQMAASGYVEGQNVTYIYHGVIENDAAVLGAEVKRLLDQQVDLLLTLGTRPTVAAQQAVAGMHIPVVFAPVMNPVKQGIVESIARPGGNITGVQVIDGAPKAVEWLLKLVPGTKTVYVPYHPADAAAVMAVKPLPEAAAQLGVELVLDAAHTPEEVLAAIDALPKDAAILFVHTPGLEARGNAIRHHAMARGIPAGAYALPADDVLFAYRTNPADIGKQAARLADQIFQGKQPADLLVATAEFFLRINLKTATAIGLDIPDGLLRQADTVMR